MGEQPLAFVGSARVQDDVVPTAARIRTALGFDVERAPSAADLDGCAAPLHRTGGRLGHPRDVQRRGAATTTAAHLDPDEFRGFALADDLAPLVFINGADTKAAQMFTLAHELAHIWLGQSARVGCSGRNARAGSGGRALVQSGRRRIAGAARRW